MSNSHLSRRDILSGAAVIGSTVALGSQSAAAKSYSGEVPWEPGVANAPQAIEPGPYQFFTPEEVSFIDAAVARLIPADDLGPGAKEAGVTVFLDRQLAGPYGHAQTWYMQGPWRQGEKTQGYQSRLTPAQLYRTAIKGINDHCRSQFGGKAFHELGAADQDKVLTALEKGEVTLSGIGPKPVEVEGAKNTSSAKGGKTQKGDTFFDQLMQNTIEGFFSDPIYGGNKDMIGWKLIGFPGARYDYRPYVSKHGEKLNLPPVGIKGRPGWTQKS